MIEIDPARLATEAAADADPLRALRERGDVAHLLHEVDVRLVGPLDGIERLAADVVGAGWHVVQVLDFGDGAGAADLQREQTTEPAAIRGLTLDVLRLAAAYGVDYDGWGTVAVTDAPAPVADRSG